MLNIAVIRFELILTDYDSATLTIVLYCDKQSVALTKLSYKRL